MTKPKAKVGGMPALVYDLDTFRAIAVRVAEQDQMAAEALVAQLRAVLPEVVAGSDSLAVQSAVAVVGSRRGWGPYARLHARARRGSVDDAVTATSATSAATSGSAVERGRRRWGR